MLSLVNICVFGRSIFLLYRALFGSLKFVYLFVCYFVCVCAVDLLNTRKVKKEGFITDFFSSSSSILSSIHCQLTHKLLFRRSFRESLIGNEYQAKVLSVSLDLFSFQFAHFIQKHSWRDKRIKIDDS